LGRRRALASAPGGSETPVAVTRSPAPPEAKSEAKAETDYPSIAVLPLNNMCDDPAQEFFADGITEDIITELARFSGPSVIARNSTFTYKGQPVKFRTWAATWAPNTWSKAACAAPETGCV
jgi:adenylate cyclase